MRQESGYNGQIVSLGGVKAQYGHGRQSVSKTIFGVAEEEVLGDNPGRVCAIIQNRAGVNVTVSLGKDDSGSFVLLPNGSFQIDQNFPWTGSVDCLAASGNLVMFAVEVSIK